MPFRESLPELWTGPQRSVIVVMLIGLFFYGSSRLLMNRSYVSDPQPAMPSRAGDLADKIDPNTTDAATLAVLPLIGERRALEIIAYREQYQADYPGQTAFKSIEDLLKIKGVGVATIDQLRPFLMFPAKSATRP